ncbi:MAG: glycosyltransferase family 2 protein [Bacteroidota bacterium]
MFSNETPLVSCIMPTYNRRKFIPNAIEYFLRQDYPNKELVIVDDGEDSIEDLIPKDTQIKYFRTNRFSTLGQKRNYCIEKSTSEYIMHWDDDDWMASYRISYQMTELLKNRVEICGIQNMYFRSIITGECWLYKYPNNAKPWLAGGSLLYTKKFWLKQPFPNIQVASDTAFIFSRNLHDYRVHPNYNFYIATIHSANTSSKQTSNSVWHKEDPNILVNLIQEDQNLSLQQRFKEDSKELEDSNIGKSSQSIPEVNPIISGTYRIKLRVAILITTYRRPKLLEKTLEGIEKEASDYDIDYFIFDDEIAQNGKKKYWKTITTLWQKIKGKSYDYYLQLPDDFKLKPNFIKKSIEAWEEIKDERKICLNIFCDESRIGKTNWTNFYPQIHYFSGSRYFKTQWTDMAHICEQPFFEQLDWHIEAISEKRWISNQNLSSGVGCQISTRLHKSNWNIYQVTDSLAEHLGDKSMMNPKERKVTPLQAGTLPKIFGGMASMPSRKNQLRVAVNSILPYLDHMFLYLNDYEFIPSWIEESDKITAYLSNIEKSNMGDAGKFYGIRKIKSKDFYFFPLDDDLIYPDNYVWTMIEKAELYNRQMIISAGGYIMKEKVKQFYKDRKSSWHISVPNYKDIPIQIPHSALSVWHSSGFQFEYKDCKKPNMADLWLALEAQKQKTPIVLCNRPSNWVKIQEVPNTDTIYHQYKDNCKEQTQVFNSYNKWNILPLN